MNLIAGLRRLRWERGQAKPTTYAAAETDDYALARRMRTAAVNLRAEWRTTLRLPGSAVGSLRDLIAEAEALRAGSIDGGAALEKLLQDARLMESCAVQAHRDSVRGLPASDGTARIALVVDALCENGDLLLSRERLLLAVASFDDVQSLEMAELWAVPEAVRVCLSAAYLRAAKSAVEIARERRAAERWVEGGNVSLSHRRPAFFEHALRLLTDREDAQRYEMLEHQLLERGSSPEQIVQDAHVRESVVRMRLENLLSNKRLIDALDWQKCFEMLSAVEQELSYDPLGIYAAMEEDSRAAVRKEVTALARCMKLGELTVARHAVRAAQLAAEEHAPESRRTICYWLYDDQGRAELTKRMGGSDAALPKRVPDPTGRHSVLGIAALFGLFYALYLAAVHSIWFVMMGIPLAWCAAMTLIGRWFPSFFKPAKLLKLKMDCVPDELRALVVMPVLLSSVERAEEICDQFEALGCLEKDGNIQYLILGDFSDAESKRQPDDAQIVDSVRRRIRAMNERAGREQYFYLHRNRCLLESDGRWMGRDRKRGALMDLNRLLMNADGAESAFQAEGAACDRLKGRFRYVLTLDADTRFLPGTVQRLIGTLAHPLNAMRVEDGVRRGYAVLQPQMEMMASACVNGFVRLFAGDGGLNTYPSSVSGFWQDVTGTGLFGGKGLYDVRAFMEALDGALPEGRILSHDLIEGALAGAAQVTDICFYDGYPASLSSFLKRLHRWTRGDWQLLPELLSTKRYPPDGRRLSAAERLRMLDNLLRSLWAPTLLGLLIQAVWMGHGDALSLGLLLAYWTPLVHLFNGDRLKWRRATAELAILPATAGCTVDAILRTLWRLLFTKKHLLDWVTSADSEKSAGNPALSNRIAAILMIPGLFVPGWIPTALAMGALFLVGPGWIQDMEQDRPNQETDAGDAALFSELARDIWQFFEEYVTQASSFLPPDNVQVDPDTGIADRTSPTNVGLYLMSCISAQSLGLITEEELGRRTGDTIASLERMEKWNGHLYNWYELTSLRPLNPRYVSSVDSGNLAAALLLCASSMEERYPSHARRMRALAMQMDFSPLYDAERGLFRIGVDAERDRPSESHYDLLASESRILSYTAIMLGQAPLKHWEKLARTPVSTGKGPTLASWSGTMFEYLMPELFMHAPENALLGQAMRTAIAAQQALGRQKQRPWGVSESGYYAFDMHLNYQYRAFGLRGLALGGQAQENVVAPYASVLAAFADPAAVAKNIVAMENLGWRGKYGLYEAADYLHAAPDGRPRLVRSYMAHHQGMALCALCNVLTDRSLSRAFQRIPEARALELLLEERPLEEKRRKREQESAVPSRYRMIQQRDDRAARPERRLVEAHLLGGAGATALVTADGMVHYQRNGIQATRFGGDLLNRSDGACVHLRRERTGETAILGGSAIYAPGSAVMTCKLGNLQCEMRLCVSPEDGALFKRISLCNPSSISETVRVADCAPAALGTPADMLAHPVFRHLFIESERVARCAVALKRRSRGEEKACPVLVHLASAPGTLSCETDFEKLVGRMGSTMQPDGIEWNMSDTVGTVLNPCTAMQSVVTVAPEQTIHLHFAYGLVEPENVEAWIERNFSESMPERAEQLSGMQARAMMGFIGLNPRKANLLQRLAALLYDGHLAGAAEMHRGEREPAAREALWALGISGDLPVLQMRVNSKAALSEVKEAIRAHDFYRTLGVKVDLVLVNEYGNDYEQPVRDALADAIAFSHLNDLRGAPGGVHLLEGKQLTKAQRTSLHRAAVIDFDASQDFYMQVRRTLAVLDEPEKPGKRMKLGENRLSPMNTQNGFGGFLADGRYAIDVLPERTTPAPWSNLMANDDFGVLLTERGGGFIWNGNSRSGRLTAFVNDVLSEGWGWMLYLVNEESGEFVPLLPCAKPQTPFRVIYSMAETVYRFETDGLACETAVCVRSDAPELRLHVTLCSAAGGRVRLVGFVDWLMGTNARDASFVRTWNRDGACFAVGTAPGVGYFAAANARVQPGCGRTRFLGHGSIQWPEGIAGCADRAGGWVLNVPAELRADVPMRSDWVIGMAQEVQQAYARVRSFYAQPAYEAVRFGALNEWKRRTEQLTVETPDVVLNNLANGWLLHQTLTSRIRGRTGLYQPGGAYGFRDQLQDMLALLPSEPRRVREHILRCAAHQFEDGDVMHWWHEPWLGVRTRIRDDMLFLPYVTAQYVKWTQDRAILEEQIHYLENVELEEGKEDRFCEMHPGALRESLHGHCMRAFRRAAVTGEHGLILMGCGDWNDGMNRVGAEGRGESVWLTEFLSACAADYAEVAPGAEDRAWLIALSDRLSAAVEASGWDGEWYLRAYMDDGTPLGGAQGEVCRIDAISQAWAVLAGLDEARCAQAIDSAWRMLVDEQIGIVRLLTPPFDEKGIDPGYIRGYPQGVRENGAQYTHAACWLLLALIRRGDAARAHRMLQLLLPASHADTLEKALVYRVEPYVLAADVYDGPHAGRGGWTWYTGSAAWLYRCILELIGFERRGMRVRVGALLGDWPEAAVTVQCGDASYRLISRRGVEEILLDGLPVEGGWIEMVDDGRKHEAIFPPRAPGSAAKNKAEREKVLQQ